MRLPVFFSGIPYSMLRFGLIRAVELQIKSCIYTLFLHRFSLQIPSFLGQPVLLQSSEYKMGRKLLFSQNVSAASFVGQFHRISFILLWSNLHVKTENQILFYSCTKSISRFSILLINYHFILPNSDSGLETSAIVSS